MLKNLKAAEQQSRPVEKSFGGRSKTTSYFCTKKKKNMTRVKRGNVSRKRHKKILNLTKTFRGAGSTLFRTANQQNIKALKYAYQNRRKKKRDFRRLWITRVNAAVRPYGINYSEFFHDLKLRKIKLNRKIIAQLSVCDPKVFTQLLIF